MMSKLKVTLVKSTIGLRKNLKDSVVSLGLGKINSFKIHDNTPDIMGKIKKVADILRIEEIK
jgi:large subunit ribosomal protein L30